MEIIRFFIVSACGVVVDILIAYAVASLLGAPLLMAAAVGFVVAALGNYILHEVWTFRKEKVVSLSSRRALFFFFSSSVTLIVRLAVVALISTWISQDNALQILICGAAISFFVNYFISRFLVFYRHSVDQSHS